MLVLPRRWVHGGIFGSTGVGKSSLGELICEVEHKNSRAKIVDLQNNKYVEAISFMFPNSNGRFLAKMKRFGIKPEGFPTRIYHPVINNLPRKLPSPFKLFTLPIDFFAYEEVLRVLTNDSMSDSAYVSLTQEIQKIGDDDSLPAIPTKIIESIDRKFLKTSGIGKVPMYFHYDSSGSASTANRPILKVKDLGIFSSQKHEDCLNDQKINMMLKDWETVTAFSTRWIDQRHQKVKYAINLYTLIKIREIAKKANNPIIVYVREARELFPNPRSSDKALKVLGEIAEGMAKDCRKAGIKLVLDTQTPWDLHDGVLDQLSLRYIFRHDKRESDILDMYLGSSSLDKERIKNIKKLRDYRFYTSYPGLPVRANPFQGNIMDFKITGHLEERDNELQALSRIFPRKDWYNTKDYIERLSEDWFRTTSKYSKKYLVRYDKDMLRSRAKSLGLTARQFVVMQFMYKYRDENNQSEKGFKQSVVSKRTSISKSSLSYVIDRLFELGFVRIDDATRAIIPNKSLFDFVEENKEVFGLSAIPEE